LERLIRPCGPLTGACRPGLAKNSPLDCFSDAAALLKGKVVIRGSVNMDVFMLGATPESLWGNAEAVTLADEDSAEEADIFVVSMKNNFAVGRVIIDSILSG